MQLLKCSLALTLLLALCHMCLAMPGVRVKRQDDLINLEDDKDNDLNPINAEDVSHDDLERNKRKLPDATFEAKNAILGFVFGNSKVLLPTRFVRATATKDYGDDVSIFDRKNVEIDFPPELFAKTTTSVLDISKVFSSLITPQPRTARSRIMRAVKGISNDDDIPEFDRNNVSVDVPGDLFNRGFSTLTKVSKTISNLMMNSARRYARFVLFFKPVFGDALTVKGYQDPPPTKATTKKPISNNF